MPTKVRANGVHHAHSDCSDNAFPNAFESVPCGKICAPIYTSPTPSPLRLAYAYLTMGLFTSFLALMPWFCVFLAVATAARPTTARLAVSGVTLFLMVWRPKRMWPTFCGAFIEHVVSSWCELFQFEVIADTGCSARTQKGCMLTLAPHGVMPIGSWMVMHFMWTRARYFYPSVAVASIILRAPIIRQMLAWVSSFDACREEILERVETGNIGLLPGGIAEMMEADRSREAVVIKSRRGFLRIAREKGLAVMPAYLFGATRMFDQVSTSAPSWVGLPLKQLSRKLRMSVTWLWGPFFLPVPYRTRVVCVIGKPLTFSPDTETLEESHERYVEALTGIYEKYKRYAGYENRELVLL